jgi:hypothetical protein
MWTFCLLAALSTPAPPKPATLVKVAVQLPDADHAQITLQARGKLGPLAPLAGHRLYLGDQGVPLEGAPDVTLNAEGFEASLVLPLARVPESVLQLDPHQFPLRYEAQDSQQNPVLVASGTLDLGDPGNVALPLRRAYELYARLDHWAVTPSLASLGISALVSFYNPFSFPITASRLELRLRSGETELWQTSRPGFRLRPQQRSDVLVQEEVPLSTLGAAVQALMASTSFRLEGQLILQTPTGPHAVPLNF